MPPPPALMDELVDHPFLRLSPELFEEVFFRLPPDEPACLVRASAVCKPWRLILADLGFRRRYREFHGTPPVMGLFQQGVSFLPISTLPTAQRNDPRWLPLDCRHGRALFAFAPAFFAFDPPYRNIVEGVTVGLIISDPLTGHERRLPTPVDDIFGELRFTFSAAVFCDAQGCDHHGCQGGHFRVAFLSNVGFGEATLGWLYSSETGAWSERASLAHPNVEFAGDYGVTSVLVDGALYFNGECIKKYHLGTFHLSMLEKPIDGNGILMRTEDGGLGFAAVVDLTDLTLWSRDTELEGWAKLRVIDLGTLLPDGALWIPALQYLFSMSGAWVSGFAEGTQVIFVSTSFFFVFFFETDVSTSFGSYMVDLKAGPVRRVSDPGRKFFPYTSFYIPAMNAVPIGQGQ